MKSIRGATTVASDQPNEIRQAVKELLWEIAAKNQLKQDDIVFILFSNTADIRSLYPAKAAREAGFIMPALYSSAEPEIEGALPLCIRVLLLADGEGKGVPVYLREASRLRKDKFARFNVALDGPAGSGKSTIAKLLAAQYDILYLDTGAMYRACALKALRCEVSLDDARAVETLMEHTCLDIRYEGGKQATYLDGEDVSSQIRTPEVAGAASAVAAHACVRKKMVEMQRSIAAKQSCVLDGRDIGTEVLPHADFKFFLTASSAVRAKRRCEDLKAMGLAADFEEVKKQIEERDYRDAHRDISPLRQAEDACLIDTSDLSVDEVLLRIHAKIQEKI